VSEVVQSTGGSAVAGGPPADQGPLLELRALRKSFGAVVAVDDVDLEVRRAEILALVGDNGAGKSTLIKMIAGVIQPNSGEIRFEGRPVHFHNPRDAKGLGIETVYQTLALVDAFDTVANIFLGRERTVISHRIPLLAQKSMVREARRLLDELGVQLPSLRLQARFLSGGQRQAVAICRAIGWGSKLVILDEPTAALGVRESDHVLEMVTSLPEKGVTAIIVSHNLEHVFGVADRIAVLRHGRTVGVRTAAECDPAEIVHLITGASAAALVQRGRARRSAFLPKPEER